MSGNVFFTSDSHFGHRRCADLRGFPSADEMNETIIANWNARVTSADRVYHLGDVALGRPEEAAKLLARLKGQIYLILGNHDATAEHRLCRDRFVWIKDYFGLRVGTQKIYLMHYAMRTWNCMHHGSIQLYGYSHGNLPDDPHSLSLDVGVDCWNFSPVSYEQVMERMSLKQFKPIDHHVANDAET